MKKLALIFVALFALFAHVPAQNCAGSEIVPDFDTANGFVDDFEKLALSFTGNQYPSFSFLQGPPGYGIGHGTGGGNSGAYIGGQVQAAGTYLFSVRATFGNTGCADTLTFQRTYVDSPTHFCDPIYVSSGNVSGQEWYVGDSIEFKLYAQGEDYDPPYKFYATGMPPGATLDSLTGIHRYRPTTPTSYSFVVTVKDAFGCTGTYNEGVSVMCDHLPNHYVTMSATVGVFTSQATPQNDVVYPPFVNYQAFSLPPGLAISSTTGVISGTPTQPGVFHSSVLYNGLGGCDGRTEIEFRVNNPAGVTQSLWINPVCASSVYTRKWEIHNPNSVDVLVNWEMLYNPGYNGAITAHPGVNNFQIREFVGWPWTIRIKWTDQSGTEKQIIQGSNDETCTPVACPFVTGVTFFHAGRQRDLQPIQPAYLTNTEKVMYEPDANDLAFNDADAVSLGFYGFITVKLSGNIYDGPGTDFKVYEHTEGNPDFGAYPERAEVFISTDNSTWVSLGLTNPTNECHAKLDWEFDIAGKLPWFRYVKVVDKTFEWAWKLDPTTCNPTPVRAFADNANGFDLDAIMCVNNAAARIASDESEVPSMEEKIEGTYAVLSPNPATTSLTFDFSREPGFISPESGQIEINIIDMAGRTMSGQLLILDGGIATHNIEQLSPGFFVAKVRTTGFAKYYKFIKN